VTDIAFLFNGETDEECESGDEEKVDILGGVLVLLLTTE
jgi:hypothetical protein